MYSREYTGTPLVVCMLLNCSILIIKKRPAGGMLVSANGS